MQRIIFILLIGSIAATTSGCVTGRRSIALEVPAATTVVAPANKGVVAITSVTDQRAFQNKPDDPSTPSIDGDVTKVSKDTLKTMIGRQRNGWGKAMGDIELAEGDTVESRMQALVAEGFKRRGYSIADSPTCAFSNWRNVRSALPATSTSNVMEVTSFGGGRYGRGRCAGYTRSG